MVERLWERLGDQSGGRCGGLRRELQEELLVGREYFFLGKVFAVTLQACFFHG